MARFSFPNATFSFLSQGAIIQEFSLHGHNLVLSFRTPEPYLRAPYFGETVGRVANRIEDGLIKNLNGRSYQLNTNLANTTHLHGGTVGWGHRTFAGGHRLTRNNRDAVLFTYISPDGEEGYPGTVELRVWYTPYEDEAACAVLEVEYEAELIGSECEETVVNVTNHSYFNLSNGPDVSGTEITLSSDDYLCVDEEDIPTGVIDKFPQVKAGATFTMGAKEPSIDHCFVVDQNTEITSPDTRAGPVRTLAHAYHASTGVHLEVSSTEPSFQFYTGDFVDVPESDHGSAKGARAGFCVEPGRFINAVNRPGWARQVVLRRGEHWGSKIVYKAWKA